MVWPPSLTSPRRRVRRLVANDCIIFKGYPVHVCKSKYFCHSQNLIQTRRKWSNNRSDRRKLKQFLLKWHLKDKVTPNLTPELPRKNLECILPSIRGERECLVIFSSLGATLCPGCGKYLVELSHQQNFIKYLVLSRAVNQSAAIFQKYPITCLPTGDIWTLHSPA